MIILQEESGMRLDKWLAKKYPTYSRNYFQNLVEEGLVLVNGRRSKKRILLQEGDEIEIEFVLTPEISLEPEFIPFDVLYEDEDFLAVNKPAGLTVHPAVGNWKHTFVNGLLYHCKQLPQGDTLRPGIVHRLDKNTSGVIIAAKNAWMHQALVSLFAERKVEKTYIAICHGKPQQQKVVTPIGRHPKRRQEMAVLPEGGKLAITNCQLIANDGHLSLIRLIPETGRTHQLRVHMKHIGCPILGDDTYGILQINQKFKVERHLLHALSLTFIHPRTHKIIDIKASVPDDMQSFIQKMATCG